MAAAEHLRSASDELLAIRAADGDVAAFEVLARRHHRRLRAYAWRLTSSSADADDAVQNALVLAWQRLPTLREPAAVRSWLMRVVARCATDILRRRSPMDDIDAVVDVAASSPDPVRAAEVADAIEALGAALATLPTLQRLCWVLREVGGESYGGIAEQLGVPSSTVRGALARARTTLATAMEEWR